MDFQNQGGGALLLFFRSFSMEIPENLILNENAENEYIFQDLGSWTEKSEVQIPHIPNSRRSVRELN